MTLLKLDAPPGALTTRDMFVPTCATCHMSGLNGAKVTHDPSDRLSFRTTFAAFLSGDALGNVTPFGFLISEPSKIVLVRNRMATEASISALTIERVRYDGWRGRIDCGSRARRHEDHARRRAAHRCR